jgi:hypothetical protein
MKQKAWHTVWKELVRGEAAEVQATQDAARGGRWSCSCGAVLRAALDLADCKRHRRFDRIIGKGCAAAWFGAVGLLVLRDSPRPLIVLATLSGPLMLAVLWVGLMLWRMGSSIRLEEVGWAEPLAGAAS